MRHESVVPKAQDAMTDSHYFPAAGGLRGDFESPSGSRAELWWGPRGKGAKLLEALKILRFTLAKKSQNTPSGCHKFC